MKQHLGCSQGLHGKESQNFQCMQLKFEMEVWAARGLNEVHLLQLMQTSPLNSTRSYAK